MRGAALGPQNTRCVTLGPGPSSVCGPGGPRQMAKRRCDTKETSGVLREKRWTWESSLTWPKELAWFRPGGVPSLLTKMLAQFVDQDTLTAITVIFKDGPSAGIPVPTCSDSTETSSIRLTVSNRTFILRRIRASGQRSLAWWPICLAEFNLTRWVACTLCHTLLHSGSHRGRITRYPVVIRPATCGKLRSRGTFG